MADQAKGNAEEPVIVKKYANRRLYNTRSSSYITLDDLARMTRDGVDFKVLDAKTGSDITHQILTQIIMEEESSGEQMLPIGFLRQLISMYGHSMQAMMPQYLEASMENFRANEQMLPIGFLRQLISMYGHSMQAMMPQYLEASMENFRANQQKLQDAWKASMDPAAFSRLAETNMAMFKAAASAFMPKASSTPAPERKPEPKPQSDLDALRAQLAEMQRKLDELGK